MSRNPWLVDSVQAFSYLKCPECDFNSKDESIFQDHAVENHPLSFVLFGENMEKDDDFIKMEPHVEMKESPGFISFSENKATKFKDIFILIINFAFFLVSARCPSGLF